jgi:hypothetical protein
LSHEFIDPKSGVVFQKGIIYSMDWWHLFLIIILFKTLSEIAVPVFSRNSCKNCNQTGTVSSLAGSKPCIVVTMDGNRPNTCNLHKSVEE